MRVRLGLLTLLAMASLGLWTIAVSSAFAKTSTYLRPNEDLLVEDGWSVVGAPTASGALDDQVTESQTPELGDYVAASNSTKKLRFGLESMSLAGATQLEATAWIYTSVPDEVVLEVFSASNKLVAKSNVSGTGWHSVVVKLPTPQSQLDGAYFVLTPVSKSVSPRVAAAFLKVVSEPSAAKVYWGAWMDGDVYTQPGEENWGDAPWSAPTWNEFQNHAGKAASIVHFGQPAPWNQKFSPEALEYTAAGSISPFRPGGAIPLMDMDADGVSLATLNSGAKDAAFKEWAQAVAAYEKPFFFRWEWEMNLPGRESAANPELFKAVWRRIHDIAENAGAKNITWVWCPNISFTGTASLKSLYPGNSYVDWTCMDGYNHGLMVDGNGWVTFESLFGNTYKELTATEFEGHEKPVMIGETASTELGGSKGEWIADALGTYIPKSFQKVKAVLWFNWNIIEKVNGTPVQRDWQIESSPAATAAFANAISSPYYAANTFGSLTPLTRIQPLP